MKIFLKNLFKIIFVILESLLYSISQGNNKKNILLLRMDNIGDLLISFPVINKINNLNENNVIILLEECREVFELYINNKNIKKIYINKKLFGSNLLYRKKIFKEIRNYNFKSAINLQSSSEMLYGHSIIKNCISKDKLGFIGDYCNQTKLHDSIAKKWYTTRINASKIKNHEIYKYIELIRLIGINDKYKHRLDKVEPTKEEKYIVVAPGSSDIRKTYDSEKLRKICIELINKEIKIIFLGSKLDIDNVNKIINDLNSEYILDLTGKTTFKEAERIIRFAKLFVGMDSALAHLAVLLGKQSIVLTGGGHENRFFPYPYEFSDNTYVIRNEMSCYGCNWKCKYETFKFPCITEISEIKLKNKINEVMSEA